MKRILIIISLLAMITLTTVNVNAQQKYYKWRVAPAYGLTHYYGDMSHKIVQMDNYDMAYGVFIQRNMSPAWGARLHVMYGHVVGSDWQNPNGDVYDSPENENIGRALNFRSEIRDANLSLIHHFDNDEFFLNNQVFMAPYLGIGIGVTNFIPRGDLLDANGNRYHYWTDNTVRDQPEVSGSGNIIKLDGEYETRLDLWNTETNSDYDRTVINIPVTLGLKFRFGERFNLNLETSARYLLSDNFDDLSKGPYRGDLISTAEFQGYAQNPGYTRRDEGTTNELNDIYSFTSVSLYYNFGFKKNSFIGPQLYAYEKPMEPAKANFESLTLESQIIKDILAENPGLDQSQLMDTKVVVDTITVYDTIYTVIGGDSIISVDTSTAIVRDTLVEIDPIKVEELVLTLPQVEEPEEVIFQDAADRVMAGQSSSGNAQSNEYVELQKELSELKGMMLAYMSMGARYQTEGESQSTNRNEPNSVRNKTKNYNTTDMAGFAKDDDINRLENKIDDLNNKVNAINITGGSATDAAALQLELAKMKRDLQMQVGGASDAQIKKLQNQINRLKTEINDLKNRPQSNIIVAPPVEQRIVIPDQITKDFKYESVNQKETVFFDLGKSVLPYNYQGNLARLARILRDNPSYFVDIKGFADKTGNAQQNMILSSKRALGVKSYLLQQSGVNSSQVKLSFFGDTESGVGPEYRKVEVNVYNYIR